MEEGASIYTFCATSARSYHRNTRNVVPSQHRPPNVNAAVHWTIILVACLRVDVRLIKQRNTVRSDLHIAREFGVPDGSWTCGTRQLMQHVRASKPTHVTHPLTPPPHMRARIHVSDHCTPLSACNSSWFVFFRVSPPPSRTRSRSSIKPNLNGLMTTANHADIEHIQTTPLRLITVQSTDRCSTPRMRRPKHCQRSPRSAHCNP